MSIDPRVTDNRPGTSPDRGMNAKNFVLIVIAAVLVLLCVGIVLVRAPAHSASPAQNQPSSSSSPHATSGSSDTGHSHPQ